MENFIFYVVFGELPYKQNLLPPIKYDTDIKFETTY